MAHILRATILVFSVGAALSILAADVIFRDKAGRVLTKLDLQNASGQFTWEIRTAKPVPQEAKILHGKGRAAGQKGDYATALDYFEKASRLSPDWPYPIYDAAFTYLLQKNSGKALALYERVDVLAPRGFFTTKTAVHALRRESNNNLPSGTYLAYLSLEWIDDPVQRKRSIEVLAQKVPGFAPIWEARATLAENDTQKLAFLEKGLAADPDPETYGFLRINQALVLSRKGERGKAIEILGALALDPSSPADIEALAKRTLATNFGLAG